jgi:cbb3-type cytochrome oxidase subunit 1
MMEWFVTRFLKASLAWFGAGITLGVLMAVRPAFAIYRTAHLHMNLLGFVAMMIFGVAYHVIPRFSGHPLHSRRLAGAHWWLANTGLALFVSGFILGPHVGRPALVLVALGGVAAAAGGYCFIYNLWRTLDGSAEARRALGKVAQSANSATARRLPVAEGSR